MASEDFTVLNHYHEMEERFDANFSSVQVATGRPDLLDGARAATDAARRLGDGGQRRGELG